MLTTITTTIPTEWRLKIAEKRWKINELIGLGMAAKEDNPQIMARIAELERTNDRLRARLEKFGSRLLEMQSDLPD